MSVCGTTTRRINIDVAVDRTILGFGGCIPGATGGCGREAGSPAGGEGEVPLSTKLARSKCKGWPCHICAEKNCRPGRPARCWPPPTSARTPSPAGCRHALALSPPAVPRLYRHHRFPKGPASGK